MLATLMFFVLIFTVFLLVAIERKQYKSYLTPFILYAIPYTFIIIYQIIVTNIYDWEPVSASYLFYVFLYLVSFYIVGTFFMSFISSVKIRKVNEMALQIEENDHTFKGLKYISVFSAIYLLLVFIINARGLPTIGMMVQEEFQTKYTSGINFYFRIICMIGTVYFWGLMNKSRKSYFVLGLLCFIPNFLTFVKGISFILILGSVIANMLINKRKLKFKTVVWSLVLGVAVLFLVYMIEIGIWNPSYLLNKQTYAFIFAKQNVYLLSGVQSFNLNIQNPYLFENISNPVYAPITNIFAKLGMTERVETINNVWQNIGYIPTYGTVSVNTNTLIGTLVLYCGPLGGLFVNVILSVLIYYFFYRAIQTRSTLKILRYSLFATGLVLAWFDYYYMQMFWLYLIILFFILGFLKRIRIKI